MLTIKELQTKMDKKTQERDLIKKDMKYALSNAKKSRAYNNLYDDPSVQICKKIYEEKNREIKEILNQIRTINEDTYENV